jgi:hypothetical protein
MTVDDVVAFIRTASADDVAAVLLAIPCWKKNSRSI